MTDDNTTIIKMRNAPAISFSVIMRFEAYI